MSVWMSPTQSLCLLKFFATAYTEFQVHISTIRSQKSATNCWVTWNNWTIFKSEHGSYIALLEHHGIAQIRVQLSASPVRLPHWTVCFPMHHHNVHSTSPSHQRKHLLLISFDTCCHSRVEVTHSSGWDKVAWNLCNQNKAVAMLHVRPVWEWLITLKILPLTATVHPSFSVV